MAQTPLTLTGARVVTADGTHDGWIRIEDGRVSELGTGDPGPGERHDVGVGHRARDGPTRDEPDEVGGIDPEDRADLVGDGPEPLEVDEPRDGGAAGEDHLGTVLLGEPLDLVDELETLDAGGGDDVRGVLEGHPDERHLHGLAVHPADALDLVRGEHGPAGLRPDDVGREVLEVGALERLPAGARVLANGAAGRKSLLGRSVGDGVTGGSAAALEDVVEAEVVADFVDGGGALVEAGGGAAGDGVGEVDAAVEEEVAGRGVGDGEVAPGWVVSGGFLIE